MKRFITALLLAVTFGSCNYKPLDNAIQYELHLQRQAEFSKENAIIIDSTINFYTNKN